MRVILFEDGLKGFGIAEVRAPSDSDGTVYPAAGRYHRTYDMTCRGGGATPNVYGTSAACDLYAEPVACIAWQDNSSSPIIVVVGGKYGKRYQNGSVTSEQTLGAAAEGAALWEDGSGNGRIVVGCGSGDKAWVRDNAAAWTQASENVYLGKMAVVGPDLYAQTNAGAASTYKVSKCVAGNDPLKIAGSEWSAGEPVGSPGWAINGMADAGGWVVVGKPDGVFVWNKVDSLYENLLPFLAHSPDPDNCKGMAAVSDGVLIPLADGSVWLYNGAMRLVSGDFEPNRDTAAALGRNTCFVDTGRVTYAPVEVFHRTTQHRSVVVKKEDGGVFTTLTTNLIDDDTSTTAAVGSLGATTEDYLYIGANIPILGAYIQIGTANTANDTFHEVDYYDGTSWVTVTSVADTTMGANGYSFEQDGYLGISPGVTGTNFHTAQAKATVDSVERYWLRFRITATGLSAGTTISEVSIQPSRPPLGGGTGLANILEVTGFDISGCVPHVLAGVRKAGAIVWHDEITIAAWGNLTAGCFGVIGTGAAQEAGPKLVLAGARYLYILPAGPSNHPFLGVVPHSFSGILWPCRVRFPERMKVERILLDIEHLDNADTVIVYMRWDQDPFFEAGTLRNSPGIVKPGHGTGRSLEVAVYYKRRSPTSALELFAPRIREVAVDVERTGDPYDAVPYLQEKVPTVE